MLRRPIASSGVGRARLSLGTLAFVGLLLGGCAAKSGDDESKASAEDRDGGESSQGSPSAGDKPPADGADGDELITEDDTSGEPSLADGGVGAAPVGGDGGLSPEEELVDSLLGDPTAVLPGGGFVDIVEDENGVVQILCGTDICQCADGIDNDGDGETDNLDGECTSPFDHDEGTFATGVPGDNSDPNWQDCFFDGNSGAGDDRCRYHTDCITGDAAPDDQRCQVADECVKFCEPLAPPGCDCFGCCEVPYGEGIIGILVSESCSLDMIEDTEACPRCTPSPLCNNECGECEVCVGKGLQDLPDHCFEQTPPDDTTPPPDDTTPPPDDTTPPPDDTTPPPDDTTPPPDGTGSPGNVCDGGATACVVSSDCGAFAYCAFGCCQALPVIQ